MIADPLHIHIIKEEFSKRATRNGSYSLRAFARDLGVSPASLSCFLNQKKGISEKKATDIAGRLDLNLSKKEQFILSVCSQHSRSPARRQESLKKIVLSTARSKHQKKIETDAFSKVNNWYCLAILELLELDYCIHSSHWFAKQLGLTASVVNRALKNMIQAGLIEYRGKKYVALSVESTTDEGIPSDDIKKYHSQVMKLAENSLQNDNVKEREFMSMILAFPDQEIQEAKKMIRDFQQAFADRFYHQTKKKKNSVYQLSMQLYRLNKKK